MLIDVEGDGVPETYNFHEHTISCIKADTKDNFLITGDVKGNVIIWRLIGSHNSYKLTVYETFKDQHAQITSIFFSYELKCFAVSSMDGSVFVYNIITSKKIRAYYHPHNLPINDVLFIIKLDHNQHKPSGIHRHVLKPGGTDLLLQHQRSIDPESPWKRNWVFLGSYSVERRFGFLVPDLW